MKVVRIGCAGEVMVEMAACDPGVANASALYRQGLAGDSFNTAVYLARAGLAVDYFTRLGDDGFSDTVVQQLQAEQVGVDTIQRAPGRKPGLYLIHNDSCGERRFSYWRDDSPARQLFDEAIETPDWDVFYFTGITLAVTRSGFENLLAWLARFRKQGKQVIFDPNYREQLWQDREQAQRYYRAVLPYCDTVLPTLDDDWALWDIDSVEQCRDFYLGVGVKELVIKARQLVSHAYSHGEHVERQAQAVVAVDTTGAGDAFNAGYLAARLTGAGMDNALEQAQELASRVVQHQGAMLPRSLIH